MILAAHTRCFLEENKLIFSVSFLLPIILTEQFCVPKKFPQTLFTKCVHKKLTKSPQSINKKVFVSKCQNINDCTKVCTKSFHKICPKSVSTKDIHKKCIHFFFFQAVFMKSVHDRVNTSGGGGEGGRVKGRGGGREGKIKNIALIAQFSFCLYCPD